MEAKRQICFCLVNKPQSLRDRMRSGAVLHTLLEMLTVRRGLRGAWLLLFVIISLGPREQTAEIPGTLSCLNNYGHRLDCSWEPGHEVGDGPFHLHFTNLDPPDANISCTLAAARGEPASRYHCTSAVKYFTELDRYQVSLQGHFSGISRTYTNSQAYEPKHNIKCDPPFNLQSNTSVRSKCMVWWSVPETCAYYLKKYLQYELAFKAHNASWEQARNKSLLSMETWADINAVECEAGINYTARVRSKVNDEVGRHYRGQWSQWSEITEFRSPNLPELEPLPVSSHFHANSTMKFWLIPLCLAVLLSIFLGIRFSPRAKLVGCMNIPTPAEFFQALYTSHNGNFKDWVQRKEAGGQLTNPNNGAEDGGCGANPQEAISQISLKPLGNTNGAPLQAPSAELQYVASRYLSEGESEEILLALLEQSSSAKEVTGTSPVGPGYSPVKGEHPPHLRPGESNSLLLGEPASLSVCCNDYCTLCPSDSSQGSMAVPSAMLLQIPSQGERSGSGSKETSRPVAEDTAVAPGLQCAQFSLPGHIY